MEFWKIKFNNGVFLKKNENLENLFEISIFLKTGFGSFRNGNLKKFIRKFRNFGILGNKNFKK